MIYLDLVNFHRMYKNSHKALKNGFWGKLLQGLKALIYVTNISKNKANRIAIVDFVNYES